MLITRRFIELWIMLGWTMSRPLTRQDSVHHYDDLNALQAPKSVLAVELGVCFGVSSRRPRKTNVENGNRLASERLKAGWLESCDAASKCTSRWIICLVDAKTYVCVQAFLLLLFFFLSYRPLLYDVPRYHKMALFRPWLFQEGRRDQDWHLNIYCLTTEEQYQHLWWQPSAQSETKSSVRTFVCLRETSYKLHIFFLFFFFWEERQKACVKWSKEKLHCCIYS